MTQGALNQHTRPGQALVEVDGWDVLEQVYEDWKDSVN